MLVGFELFRRLSKDWDRIEVFPQAIAAVLDVHHIHKSHQAGVVKQLAAVRLSPGYTTSVRLPEGVSSVVWISWHFRMFSVLDKPWDFC
jgi:hypothetical protein